MADRHQGAHLLQIRGQREFSPLAFKGGNVTQAAVYLGIPRHVLAYRMQKYGIDRPR